MTKQLQEKALRYAAQHQRQHLDELVDFLSIPSVSTKPEQAPAIKAAAAWLAEAMQQAGLEHVRIIETEGHPLVYADWLHAGPDAPTVLFYGHYDVQPAEPLEEWQSAPFAPEIRDNYIYARGASDDKGQLYIHVKAVESYLASEGTLPVNVKFIVEGEEEIGGANLTRFVQEQGELLRADVVVVSDTQMIGRGQPSIVYGLRGAVFMLIDVTGPEYDVHSGIYGGGINNPINVLGHIIASLKDTEGRVLIPGFYDDVHPISDEERALLTEVPLDPDEWLAETGAPAVWGEPEYTLVERLEARPTLDVNGIVGGYTGPGGKTIIPARAHAKISMRLVPDQDPHKIQAAFRRYVEELAPPSVKVDVRFQGATPATIIDFNTGPVQAAADAYAQVFGKLPVFRREGGSIPVVGDFQRYLGLETVLLGFGLPDDRVHSPNERFYLPNFYLGIETVIHYLRTYADWHRNGQKA